MRRSPADYPRPPFPEQSQELPGSFRAMSPVPDHGETSWHGTGRLEGRVALITGGDSGIGRAVAIAYAREGCDLVICHLPGESDAADTADLLGREGHRVLTLAADLSKRADCLSVIRKAVAEFGRIDILVNNAAHQQHYNCLEDISPEAWAYTFAVNVDAIFHLVQAALPYMSAGSSIINTVSINSDAPNPGLLPYACTKGAVHNLTAGLAQSLAPRGIRVNCVAPGPVWTPLIPATLPAEDVKTFGAKYPMGRPAQPAELAGVYVMLAEETSGYISGATVAVTGGKPFL